MKLLSPLAFLLLMLTASAAEYPVAFLSHPKTTGVFHTQSVSESSGPYTHHPGTDLAIGDFDGTALQNVRVLVQGKDDAKRLIAVHDHCVSLDGKSILYSHIRTFEDRSGLWCDLFRINLETNEITQLTDSKNEFSPPVGSGAWQSDLSIPQGNYPDRAYGNVWNMSPCDTPSGIVFTSNRKGIKSPGEHYDAQQLFRVSHDGKIVEQIGIGIDLGGAAHPTIRPDGRLDFSTAQQQTRGGYGNNWGTWSINPDGTDWRPEVSAIQHQLTGFVSPWHFQCRTTDGTLFVERYYDARVYGTIHGIPRFTPSPFGPRSPFGKPLAVENPFVKDNWKKSSTVFNAGNLRRFGFQPVGMFAPFPWATDNDSENVDSDGAKLGMLAHPAATPNNGLLYVWTGDQGDGNMRLRLCLIPDVSQTKEDPRTPGYKELVSSTAEIQEIYSPEDRHCWMPKAVVSFADIYGFECPEPEGKFAKELPPGSPFAVIGTSSLNWREITIQPDLRIQFPDEKIEYIRVTAFNPTTRYGMRTLARGPEGGKNAFLSVSTPMNVPNLEGFFSQINERMGVLADIPVKKWQTADGSLHVGPDPGNATPILDSTGKPDTSFKAIIPADLSFTFQLLDKDKRVILDSTAHTWRQVRPGEQRWDCGGCHAHNQAAPMLFEDSFAATPEYPTKRYETVQFVEYFRDVKPIQDAHNLDWGPEAWKTFAKRYESAKITADLSLLNPQEKETVYRWVDTGLMAAGQWAVNGARVKPSDAVGPYADTVEPALAAKLYADRIIVGAFDAQSGLNKSSLSVRCDQPISGRAAGEELADLFTHNAQDWTWTLSTALPKSGTLTVSVRDNQEAKNASGEVVSEAGNIVVKTFALGGETSLPDADTEEILKLKAEIEKLKTQIETLNATVKKWMDWYDQGGALK